MHKGIIGVMLLILLVSTISANEFGYNYLDEGEEVFTGGNYTIDVNNSYYLRGLSPQEVADLFNEVDPIWTASLWAGITGFFDDWLFQSGTDLAFNETKLNKTIASYTSNLTSGGSGSSEWVVNDTEIYVNNTDVNEIRTSNASSSIKFENDGSMIITLR